MGILISAQNMYWILSSIKVLKYWLIIIDYIEESFRSYIRGRPSFLEFSNPYYVFQVNSGYLKISNNSIFTNQSSLINAVYSTIILDGVVISDSISDTDYINIVESTTLIQNLDIKNISVSSNVRFLSILSSDAELNKISYTDSETVFLRAFFTNLNMTEIYSK